VFNSAHLASGVLGYCRFMMKSSTTDQIAGKIHEVKGAVKEAVGKAAGRPDIADEGTAEKITGVVQKKVGQVKKVFGH